MEVHRGSSGSVWRDATKRHARGPKFFLPVDRDYRPRDERDPVYRLWTDRKRIRGAKGSKKLGRLFGRDKNRSVIRRILLRRFYYSETRESADGKCHKVKYVASASQLVFFPLPFFSEHSDSTFPIAIEVYTYTCAQGVPKNIETFVNWRQFRAISLLWADFRYELLLSRNQSDIRRRK